MNLQTDFQNKRVKDRLSKSANLNRNIDIDSGTRKNKLINKIMLDGLKTKATKIVESAFKMITEDTDILNALKEECYSDIEVKFTPIIAVNKIKTDTYNLLDGG